jgi:exodeoxyribonuclease V beta subunit
VHDVEARHQGTRLAGAPHPDPFRLRVVARTTFGKADDKLVAIDDLRSHIGKDLAAETKRITSLGCLTPDLWIEPLGALVKTGPAIVLMLVALLMLDNR